MAVTTIIMGGGQGKRLFPLTSYRSKPAVPIGGKYRLVDIPLSNSINSGLRRVFVLTQFNSMSLHRHIHRTYPYEPFSQTSVELLAAEQTIASKDWFQGTADAVRKNMQHYRVNETDRFLVLSGDHLYRMDYRKILDFHVQKKADVTIATVPVRKKEVSGFGIMQLSSSGQITAFREKPSPTERIQDFVIPRAMRKTFQVKGKEDLFLASMGVYVFEPKALQDILAGNEADFGKEVIPKAISKFQVYGFVFNDYWRDIGTIRSYYEASIEMTKPNPPFKFLSPTGRLFTRPRFLPPSKIYSANLTNVVMSEGCYLDGVHVEDSIIGLRSVIHKGTVIRKSIVIGNDFYELGKTGKSGKSGKYVPLGVGKNCQIENAILDKNVRIGNSVSIVNQKGVNEKDGDNYYIRDGIVIIPKGAVIRDGTKI